MSKQITAAFFVPDLSSVFNDRARMHAARHAFCVRVRDVPHAFQYDVALQDNS